MLFHLKAFRPKGTRNPGSETRLLMGGIFFWGRLAGRIWKRAVQAK